MVIIVRFSNNMIVNFITKIQLTPVLKQYCMEVFILLKTEVVGNATLRTDFITNSKTKNLKFAKSCIRMVTLPQISAATSAD